MDRIALYRKRKEDLLAAGGKIRAEIAALTDADSFVELSAFGFSKDAFYGEDAKGEGVVTGFATIGGYPFSIIAQNFEISYGGLSKANCEKMCKTLSAAEKNGTPVVYLLHSQGVRVGEGVDVLEGIGELLLKATQLKGVVPQYAVLLGEVYGSAAALASICDFVLFEKGSSLLLTSPLVLSAKLQKDCKGEDLGGYNAQIRSLLPSIQVKDTKEAASAILRISDLLSVDEIDSELNDPAPALNKKAGAKEILSVLENGVEIGATCCPELKTVLARLGGIAVAAVVFDNVLLNENNVRKLRYFSELACCYHLPLLFFVDCGGIDVNAHGTALYKEIGEYLSMLDAVDTAKISVVTGRAIGIAYSLFAAKSAGFDYTYAFATSEISLFESAAGAQIEYSNEVKADKEKIAARYSEENADPVNAAKGGYLDNIIEPQFIKQYLVASLQTVR